ncbi:MAG: SGNH/GDSL hydrolase family protein [Armatimonadota bacterium]
MSWWSLAVRSLVIMMVLEVGSLPTQAKVLLRSDFEKDPLKAGWCAWAPDDNGAAPQWAEGGAHAGTRYLAVARGRWRSPMIPVTPGEYYLAEAYIRGDGPGLWHALYFDGCNGKLESSIDIARAITGICTGTDQSAEWQRQVMCFRAAPGVTHAQLVFEPRLEKTLAIDDLTVRTATWQEAARWAKSIYAGIPPITYTPPADRWQHLPQTRNVLRKGGSLRMVLLGSSNINDVSSSYFELRIRQRNPKAVIDPIISVRGSTGCTFYQAPEQVKAYVLDYKPDTLVIECSAFGSTIDAIRSVIRQVRAAGPAEIVLATNAGYDEAWLTQIDPNGTDFIAGVQRLANEEKVAFLDLGRPASRYFAGCGKPYEFFRRDKHHFNDRGKQAMAHIVAAFFAVK